ncbi:MAG: glycosyltransferase family 39 protein, partial [Elusimicrobiales bacterium]|nr:glycosyltransferase family 39 protein [Elusimicrobiales bacterium]
MQLKKILDILHGAAGRLIFKCLLVLLPFFVYYPSLSYENVYLDDDALTENSSAGIKKIFSKDVFLGKDTKSGFYRPLMALSFYADRRISQFLRPNTDNHQIPHGMLFISHFCNILLHGIFCLFLYEMLLSYGNSARMSCCCAALFAVIPYNAVAVSWLGGRNDILLGIFLLVSSIYIKKYSEKYAFRHLAALSLFFLLALFTKETAIAFVIPAFVLLFADTHEKKHFLRLFIALSLPVMIYFLCRFNADLAQNAFSHIDLKG